MRGAHDLRASVQRILRKSIMYYSASSADSAIGTTGTVTIALAGASVRLIHGRDQSEDFCYPKGSRRTVRLYICDPGPGGCGRIGRLGVSSRRLAAKIAAPDRLKQSGPDEPAQKCNCRARACRICDRCSLSRSNSSQFNLTFQTNSWPSEHHARFS